MDINVILGECVVLAFGKTEPIWGALYKDDSDLGNVTYVAIYVFDYNNCCFKAVVGNGIVAKT